MSKREQVARTGEGLFWRGLIAGLAVAAVALALATGAATRRGVAVTVETTALSRRMEEEVRQAVRRELPVALGAVRAELSRQLSTEAGRRLAGVQIDLGGFAVPIPAAAVQQVEQAMDQALRTGLDAAIRAVNVDGWPHSSLGGQAASPTRNSGSSSPSRPSLSRWYPACRCRCG